MADSNVQLQWTDEQWNKVRQVVYEEARRARVAGSFLPLFGPLDPDATYVTRELLLDPTQTLAGFSVDDTGVQKLSTLQVKIYLRGAQVADPELASALIAFRRAANIVARLEDKIIFRGQPAAGQPPSPDIGEVVGGERTEGLLDGQPRHTIRVPGTGGAALVTAVSQAIAALEQAHHLGPFACVLGNQYFNEVQTPQPNSLVLPQDRILPFLGGGALLRTSTLPDDRGLVIALGGQPIDLVVGTDISVNFLQVTLVPWFVFRVYEKIVLRIKQIPAIAVLHP